MNIYSNIEKYKRPWSSKYKHISIVKPHTSWLIFDMLLSVQASLVIEKNIFHLSNLTLVDLLQRLSMLWRSMFNVFSLQNKNIFPLSNLNVNLGCKPIKAFREKRMKPFLGLKKAFTDLHLNHFGINYLWSLFLSFFVRTFLRVLLLGFESGIKSIDLKELTG